MTTLLEITDTLSPRLAWLTQHGLFTREYQHPHSLNGAHRWVCCNRSHTRYASADTEQGAEAAYAARYDIPWYALDTWNAAMQAVSPANPTVMPLSGLEGWE